MPKTRAKKKAAKAGPTAPFDKFVAALLAVPKHEAEEVETRAKPEAQSGRSRS